LVGVYSWVRAIVYEQLEIQERWTGCKLSLIPSIAPKFCISAVFSTGFRTRRGPRDRRCCVLRRSHRDFLSGPREAGLH